jgi:hypothetical protein
MRLAKARIQPFAGVDQFSGEDENGLIVAISAEIAT